MNFPHTYQNGNCQISLELDGSRTLSYEDELELEFPLNIDIRVSNRCSFGQRPDGTWALCSFCHESAKTDGQECNYQELQDKLLGLPAGIELAIGSNELTDNLYDFLIWCKDQGYICNLTVNQGHLRRDLSKLLKALNSKLINGLGISYRSILKWDIPDELLTENTVFHVIAGIDDVEDILKLSEKGVDKILILGEKDFGGNLGNVNLKSDLHKKWRWWLVKVLNAFEIVSFDNLALTQLKVRRYIDNEDWEIFHQGEYSFYIDAADQTFKPSSRSPKSLNWENTDVKSYFKELTAV